MDPTEKTVLEEFVNQAFPVLAHTYQQYSKQDITIPRITIKDRVGFVHDHIKKNTADTELSEKVEIIFEEGCKYIQANPLDDDLEVIRKTAHRIILGEKILTALKATSHEELIKELETLPQGALLDRWLDVFYDAEFALPNDLGIEISLGDKVMFVKPEVSKENIYILKWDTPLIKNGTIPDNVKKTLLHESAHLLTYQLEPFQHLRSNRSLPQEEQLAYKWLDEGAADFIALFHSQFSTDLQSSHDHLKATKRISRIFDVVNVVHSLVFRAPREINAYKHRLQGYQFCQHLYQQHGLKEVFTVLQNPQGITLEMLASPKKYHPTLKT